MGASSLPPLSEQDRRRDPPSLGAPRAPVCAGLPPGAQSGQATLRTRNTPCRNPWGAGRRAAGQHRPGHQLPPSFKSTTCAQGGLEVWGRVARPRPRLFVLPTLRCRAPEPPRSPPWPQPGRPPRRGARRAPPGPSSWHSQWRRGGSCKLGAVRAAGAQAGPEPGALQRERTTRRYPAIPSRREAAAAGEIRAPAAACRLPGCWRPGAGEAAGAGGGTGRGGAWAHHPIGEEAGWGGAALAPPQPLPASTLAPPEAQGDRSAERVTPGSRRRGSQLAVRGAVSAARTLSPGCLI